MSFSNSTALRCEGILEKTRWPSGFVCPKFKSTRHCLVWHDKLKTFQCNRCHNQVTLTAGTIFHATKLSLVIWFRFQALFLITQTKNNISAMELMRVLGVCYRTSWRLKHKLMQVMLDREENTVLSGRVEVDDSYLGGEKPGGKVGRGSENKVPFMAAVQTNEMGHPLYAIFSPVKAFSSEEITAWAYSPRVPLTTVISDGLVCFCFRAVTAAGCHHELQVAGKGRKSTDMGCFFWTNTIFDNLKNAISRTYHAFGFQKYAGRYLAEAQYRFNRRFDLRSMLQRLVWASVHTGKRTEKRLRLAEA